MNDGNWIIDYVIRLADCMANIKIQETGPINVHIYTHDLLEKSKLSKTDFYQIIFFINNIIDDRIVLYLKGVHEKKYYTGGGMFG